MPPTTLSPACPVSAAFEERALADPSAPALVRRGTTLTYGALLDRVRDLAAALTRRRGPGSEPVALMLADPADMVPATLAVLRAGKVYVPVNPHHPEQRVRAVLEQVGATAVVVRGPVPAGVPDLGPDVIDLDVIDLDAIDLDVIDLDAIDPDGGDPGGPLSGAPAAVPEVPVGPADPAYVLFTSGSTGEPRGYAQSRGAMTDNVDRHAALGLRPDDRVTLINADGFVTAVSNPFIALLSGAALAPWSFQHDDVHAMMDWVDEVGVTVVYAFPSFLRRLGSVVPPGRTASGVRLVYLGGEPVRRTDVALARRLFPDAGVAVGLNSTETGLTLLHVLAPGEDVPDPVPVGSAVPGVEVRVVDDAGDDADVGVPGEILAIGRWLRPRRWDRGRTTDAAQALPGDRWSYRTGDRGRWDGHGRLVHLGRADGMVKVRGFRVETVEVEDALTGVAGVADAAVVVEDDAAGTVGDVELVAHVTLTADAPTTTDLRRALAATLPGPSVPSRIEVHDVLPRTANGKLDRRALRTPPPAAPVVAPAPDATPAGSVEERVAALCSELLGVDTVARSDDFFALGGTSISALRVVSRVRKEWGASITLASFFATPTVETLVDAVRAAERATDDTEDAEAPA